MTGNVIIIIYAVDDLAVLLLLCYQTVGVDFLAKQVQIPKTNTWVEFYLFDCAGHSIFNQRNLNSRHVRLHTTAGASDTRVLTCCTYV